MAGLGDPRPRIRCALVGALTILVVAACSGWNTYQDKSGVSVDVPSDWQVSVDPDSGRIDIVGAGDKTGDEVMIQPFFTPQALEPAAAARVLDAIGAELAAIQWQPAVPQDEGSIQMTGTADGKDAVAILKYAASAKGTAGNVFVALVPSGRLAQDAETLAKIMGSLQVSGPPSGNAPAPIAYATWPDPSDARVVAATQGAFSLEVPQDFGTQGGMQMLGNSFTQWWVDSQSSAKDIDVQIGNRGFPLYYKPNFYYPQGRTVTDDLGVHPVETYRPGARCVTELFGRTLADFQARGTWNLPRVATIEPAIAGVNRFDAGMADFTFTKNGESFHGGAMCLTEEVITGALQSWDVKELVFWYGTEDMFDTATEVMAHMYATFRVNPDWAARYGQTVLAQSRIISQSAREVSGIIASTFGNIDVTSNELRRRRGNAIVGTVDVAAPDGETYKVENSANHYWLSNGTIFGTTTSVPPCQNCQELITRP